jgi:peptide/nickel transport system permease protein
MVLSALVFGMSRLTGDPRDLLLSDLATQEEYEELGRQLGLDQPITVQYWRYISNAVQGDLGLSLRTREPITNVLASRLVATLVLVFVAMAVSFVIGIPAGAAAAYYGGGLDVVASAFSLLGQSFPAFWVGLVLIELVAARFQILPAGGFQSPDSVVLPAATLAVFGIATVVRVLRNEMNRILRSEYIRFARTTGVSERTLMWRHAFPNALLPILSFSGLMFVIMITTLGTVVETLFAWPGLGQLTFSAIQNRDFPVVQGVVLLVGALAIVVSLLVDLLYMRADPRIRYDRRS